MQNLEYCEKQQQFHLNIENKDEINPEYTIIWDNISNSDLSKFLNFIDYYRKYNNLISLIKMKELHFIYIILKKKWKTLAELRYSKNITQIQLSEMTGISQTQLSKIEAGLVSPFPSTRKKIEQALGGKINF